ncbi:MAG: hypothetical protein [Caudoviricetes sp.]|nr:MAG: hypothetical protein [Caudoviricetes sp.]
MEYHELPNAIEKLRSMVERNNTAIEKIEGRCDDVVSVEVSNRDCYVNRVAMLDLLRSQNESYNCQIAELMESHKVLIKLGRSMLK